MQTQNAELRKKLRVDKMRKKIMGGMGTGMDIENPLSNDWQKMKSLKEIEIIRDVKKDEILE